MSIKFKVVTKRNARNLEAPHKYYAATISNGKTELDDLAKYATETSSVSKADVLAVLESVFTKIAIDVADGKNVYVGEYFSVRASISSTGSENIEDVNAKNITKVRTIFKPGKLIKNALKLASFKKVI
ncbi:DNA-binding protein [Tenacibaculum sp. 190524A02b]|uniref:HU family DNA-binding protein n=1 Tax=Tenacibaculum vairaonense TaxID=3137860 RepID=UPI0031FB428A